VKRVYRVTDLKQHRTADDTLQTITELFQEAEPSETSIWRSQALPG